MQNTKTMLTHPKGVYIDFRERFSRVFAERKHAFREDWVSPFNELRFGRDLSWTPEDWDWVWNMLYWAKKWSHIFLAQYNVFHTQSQIGGVQPRFTCQNRLKSLQKPGHENDSKTSYYTRPTLSEHEVNTWCRTTLQNVVSLCKKSSKIILFLAIFW